MKIAFITTYNAKDINNWSGTPYYITKAFTDAGVNVEFIGELSELPKTSLFSRFKNLFFNRIFSGKYGKYIAFYEPDNLKYIASQVKKKLEYSDADLVFSPGAIPIAYLNTKKPVVMWSDATFAVMYNYYNEYTDFNRSTIRNCHRYEKNVIERLSLAIFSSDWAAKSAIKNYGAKEEIIKVVPYGANINCDRTIEDIVKINMLKSRKVCKLLFIGQDWDRKGGETAVSIAKELNERNIITELTIVGCKPPSSSTFPEFIRVLGYIDKSKKAGNDLIENLYRESHFFVLPTIAECTPIVFSEANSYGLPIITHNTGGIPSIVYNEINGKMFDINSHAMEWAIYLGSLFSDFDKYNNFSMSAFNEYSTRLNWGISIEKVILSLEEVVRKSHRN